MQQRARSESGFTLVGLTLRQLPGLGRMRDRHADGHLLSRRQVRGLLAGALLLAGLGLPKSAAAADPAAPPLGPMIAAAAQWAGLTPELLAAVVWVESRGWPWALNVRGQSIYPQSHAEAVRLLRRLGPDGVDIGIAQIHYPIWGPALGLSPEQLLDPWTNLHAAALILRYTMILEPGWGGVGRYHSATPKRKWPYARAVAETWRALTGPLAAPQ